MRGTEKEEATSLGKHIVERLLTAYARVFAWILKLRFAHVFLQHLLAHALYLHVLRAGIRGARIHRHGHARHGDSIRILGAYGHRRHRL